MFYMHLSCDITAYKISLTPYTGTPYSEFFIICSKPIINIVAQNINDHVSING